MPKTKALVGYVWKDCLKDYAGFFVYSTIRALREDCGEIPAQDIERVKVIYE